MKNRFLIVIALLTICMTSCYLPISGSVIDAETNQPIEGAVVLVEWTKTIGFGLTYTESYKVAEALSDKDGKFELPGCYSPFVNVPDVTVYKKGYVAWNNNLIFPSYTKRDDFKWQNKATYKLLKFRPDYSIDTHISFIAASGFSVGSPKMLWP